MTLSLEDISHPDDLALELAENKLMLAGQKDSYEMDKRFVSKDGAIVWGRLTVGCVRKSDRSLDYFVGVLEDITLRKQAEEELRKREERFRSSLLHSPLPIMLYDDQEQVLAVSGSWLEASGYSRGELRSIEEWTARAYRERQPQLLARMRWIISTEPEALASEHAVYTKDGRERHWSFVTSALGSQSDGRRLFITVAQDVTERKVHEEQVSLLMREVNHRAKNMLSVVQAIARQTAAREPEVFIDCFTERIRALAANLDLLVRNEWRGVDMEDLVRAQLAYFADLVGSRIVMQGPRLRLTAAAAHPVHVDAAGARRQRAVFSGIGGKLMERKPDRLGGRAIPSPSAGRSVAGRGCRRRNSGASGAPSFPRWPSSASAATSNSTTRPRA
jgi:PAS domain S-box-containing protein